MLEDTAESASLMPTLRVQNVVGGDRGKETAIAMEQIGMAYQDENEFDLFILEVPLFGPLLIMVAVARFSRTLATCMVEAS